MNKNYTEHLIIKLCSQPRSIDYITQRLNGVDPVGTIELLKELEQKNAIRCQEGLWLIEEKAKKEITDLLNPDPQLYLKKYMGDFDFFKKPHPLDFEWRNTKKSVNYLSEIILQSNQIDDNILILGMPTLFAGLCKRDIPQKVTIVERNEAVINTLRDFSQNGYTVLHEDIFKVDPAKIGMFSTVIMDPPWYEPHFKQFIWLASRCLKLGGRLIISIPPINTRPGIDAERIKWFSFCQQQGLCLENLYAGKLEYSMPFFEWNATRIAGVEVNPFWRKGDIAIFQKLNMQYVDRPTLEEDHVEDWKEIEINSCRIRVKISSLQTDIVQNNDDFEIRPLVPTQILPSVSNRNPIRKEANVWTSGNRIFYTNDPVKLFTYLQYFKNKIPETSDEGLTTFHFIEVISGNESKEYNNYLEWLYFEMEREP